MTSDARRLAALKKYSAFMALCESVRDAQLALIQEASRLSLIDAETEKEMRDEAWRNFDRHACMVPLTEFA